MKNYYSKHGISYQPETDSFGWKSIEVLSFLKGREWDEIALAFVHALRPSTIRVTDDYVTCDSQTWRVTVMVDGEGMIKKIEQEVEVWLPDGVEHGHALGCALKKKMSQFNEVRKKDIEKLMKAPFDDERTEDSPCTIFQLKAAPISDQIKALELSGKIGGFLFFLECTSSPSENVEYGLCTIYWIKD